MARSHRGRRAGEIARSGWLVAPRCCIFCSRFACVSLLLGKGKSPEGLGEGEEGREREAPACPSLCTTATRGIAAAARLCSLCLTGTSGSTAPWPTDHRNDLKRAAWVGGSWEVTAARVPRVRATVTVHALSFRMGVPANGALLPSHGLTDSRSHLRTCPPSHTTLTRGPRGCGDNRNWGRRRVAGEKASRLVGR